jgi:hypothetical protein
MKIKEKYVPASVAAVAFASVAAAGAHMEFKNMKFTAFAFAAAGIIAFITFQVIVGKTAEEIAGNVGTKE